MSEDEDMAALSGKTLEEIFGDEFTALDKDLRPLEGGEKEKVKKLATKDTNYGKNDQDEETIHVEDDCPNGSDCDRELHPERPEYTHEEKKPKQLSGDIIQTSPCEPDCPGGNVKMLKGADRDGLRVSEASCGHCHQILGRSDTVASLQHQAGVLRAYFDEQGLSGKTLEEELTSDRLSGPALEDILVGQLAGKSLEEIFEDGGA